MARSDTDNSSATVPTIKKAIENKNVSRIPETILAHSQLEDKLKTQGLHLLLRKQNHQAVRNALGVLETRHKGAKPIVFHCVADWTETILNQDTVPDLTPLASYFKTMDGYAHAKDFIPLGQALIKQGYTAYADKPILETAVRPNGLNGYMKSEGGQSVLKTTLKKRRVLDSDILTAAITRGEVEMVRVWAKTVCDIQDSMSLNLLKSILNQHNKKIAQALVQNGYEPPAVEPLVNNSITHDPIGLAQHKTFLELFDVDPGRYGTTFYELALKQDRSVWRALPPIHTYLNYLHETLELDPANHIDTIPDDVDPDVRKWLKDHLTAQQYAAYSV